MNREQFRERLQQSPLLLDGAMGTQLHSRGHGFDRSFDALNLRDPATVADVHHAYIAAGADIIETNTFGANRYRLEEHSLADQVVEINRAAVTIARRVIDSSFKPVLLAGSIGPLGVRLAPLGRVAVAEAQLAFREQIAAQLEAGIDLLIIETMSDVAEVQAAVKAVRELSSDLPLLAMMTFAQDDRTLLGMTAADVARRLTRLDVDGIGVNCSAGPNQVLRIASALHHVSPDIVIAAMPNAGFPERGIGGRVYYPATAQYFADYALAFIEAGINIIGGCCGTTADHIAAMRTAIATPRPSPIAQPQIDYIEMDEQTTLAADPPTKLATALRERDFIVTVEMRPPKGIAAQRMLASARMLRAAGANFVDVADIPLARMRMSAWAAAYLIQKEIGLETILHFPTRGRNLLRVQADLLAAHALGVRNLFVTMGDPARIGDYPDAMDSYDIVSTGLIRLITGQMNVGRDKAGAKLDQPTNFTVGCAASLVPRDVEKEMALLEKKIRYGANFALTQPIFDAAAARSYLLRYEEQLGPRRLPLIIGIQPLFNARNAEFLHNEVPGIVIPEAFRRRMADARDPQLEGIEIACEIVEEMRDLIDGVYIIPAFGRYDIAADVIERVRPPLFV